MKGMTHGFADALRLTLEHITPLSTETISLLDSVGSIAAEDLYALIDSPSMDSSRKDGYAVRSGEVAGATPDHPVRLRLVGSIAAGGANNIGVIPGTTVRVLTGACIPEGADAVVSEEFAVKESHEVLIENPAAPKNILPRGSDVSFGQCLLSKGSSITPVMAGLLALAGHSRIPVYRSPAIGIVGTGDEIIEPGEPLPKGKIYASNIITLAGWCRRYGGSATLALVPDDPDAIFRTLHRLSLETDALITSGGAWTGDHDMVASVLGSLGWEQVFHRIRIGPGKGVGFGMLGGKPVFVLPGGPPSNLMAFLQIALPGLQALSGDAHPGLPRIRARLGSDLVGGDRDWTDFFFGTLSLEGEMVVFYPMMKRSRLSAVAGATAIGAIPEGEDSLHEGEVIGVQLIGHGMEP
ncbi:MAG TPA: molybdopterin molybdotransferase MoeA [Methanoregulaceae archaeon]|nr:molybdopterin molybdotransferase MoeA [Methanoregulaceae archaeon]